MDIKGIEEAIKMQPLIYDGTRTSREKDNDSEFHSYKWVGADDSDHPLTKKDYITGIRDFSTEMLIPVEKPYFINRYQTMFEYDSGEGGQYTYSDYALIKIEDNTIEKPSFARRAEAATDES